MFDATNWGKRCRIDIFQWNNAISINPTQGQRFSSECMQVRDVDGGRALVVLFPIHGLALAKGYNLISSNLHFLISQNLLLQCRHQKKPKLRTMCPTLKLRTMRPTLKGLGAKRGFSGRCCCFSCEYYFLLATLPNVFSYTFGWTTTLQKSKIEQTPLYESPK